MQISSRFTIALHIFACVEVFGDEYRITSDFLAGSINPNPECPVGKNIHKLLDSKLETIQKAMENEMRKYTLESLGSGRSKNWLKRYDIYPSDNEWDFEWFIWEREIIGRIDYAYIFNFIDVL